MAMVTDDYSPVYIGDNSTPLAIHFYDHFGSVWQLTNQTGFTITFTSVPNEAGVPSQSFVGAGTATITDPANGVGQYVLASTDVATPGLYNIQIKLLPSGKKFDYKLLEIRP